MTKYSAIFFLLLVALAAPALAKVETRDPAELTAIIRDAKANAQDRMWAAQILGAVAAEAGKPELALPVLLKALESKEVALKRGAVTGLGLLKEHGREAVPALIRCLQDKDLGVRARSAQALPAVGASRKEALPVLKKALEDPEWFVRVIAAVALRAYDRESADAFSILAEALERKDKLLRRIALKGLYDIALDREMDNITLDIRGAASGVIQCLDDEDDEVVVLALVVLRHFRIPLPHVVPTLEKLRKHPHPRVRKEAAQALRLVKR